MNEMLDPKVLASHYSRFRVSERLLLTGHSHQAWPDVGFEAQQQAWLDAAEWLDDKWPLAMAQADRVRAHWQRLLGDRTGEVALGQNTHELVTRLLSALPLVERPRLVTTDGEFHTIARQLARLAEAGLEVAVVPARPVDELVERLLTEATDATACVLVSSVLFETAELVPGLDRLARRCQRHGVTLLVDAYHHLNAVPFDIARMGLETAFVTGGGYKYCQLGEGNAFLRVPADTRLRPVLTGWYAEFTGLSRTGARQSVSYGEGAAAFAGATYDPVSHYRAAAVFDFQLAHGMTPQALRRLNRHQVTLLQRALDDLDLDPATAQVLRVPEERRGGFLALRAPRAGELVQALRSRGVLCDHRGSLLRLGPAPYLRDEQLLEAVSHLHEALRVPV